MNSEKEYKKIIHWKLSSGGPENNKVYFVNLEMHYRKDISQYREIPF